MSVSYSSEATLDSATWVAVLLSERDVAGQIPINFVTNPAVSLTAACFGDGLYDKTAATKCISNLLSVGYRRLILDIYWSVEHRTWTFCPVDIPTTADIMLSAYTSTVRSSSTTSTVTSTSTESASTSTSMSTTTEAADATITGYTDSQDDKVYELGPYRCTKSLDLYTISQILVGYFQNTRSREDTYTTWLALNLHVAGSDSAPTEPTSAVTGDDLPKTETERAGSYLGTVLSDYIYTPAQLAKDRSNLNESWYEVEESYMPIVEYYTIHTDESGQQSTPDGWPSAKYIQFAKSDRILIEYGSVDPQLAEYDLSQDEDKIFSPHYMFSGVDISTAENGTVTSGCLYEPGATAVSQANSSWATSQIPVTDGLSTESTMGSIADIIAGITACGMSPMLNSTLFDQSADASVEHYRNVSLSTSWAWAVGEPQGAGTGGGTNDEPAFDRCSIMDLSLEGRWRATNCTEVRRGACRVGNSPFSWTVTNASAKYSDISESCPPGSTLAVPRTGLENTYLYKQLLSEDSTVLDSTSSDPALREIFLDFNCIDITSCWVTGGPQATCPYANNPQQLERKTVLVSVVAGVVICVIFALTVFVKCNTNRRNSRRRKRVIEGWEYEGVPS
ncbi:uncharacterized protein N7484_005141 [Penicillium longicatenatum]|uniref:uncharacterized protein n=1 Tax=Penicillium longicatenatum TaxID=1561947 RepID=UPI002546881B|nr:uncharacterized protein N7484_005141 [Penicillium longicatenatum]KAJ5651418.1 hypothetical protein N7484_005141 [Penicillium longicatenatum]